jgi:hypothetical protein
VKVVVTVDTHMRTTTLDIVGMSRGDNYDIATFFGAVAEAGKIMMAGPTAKPEVKPEQAGPAKPENPVPLPETGNVFFCHSKIAGISFRPNIPWDQLKEGMVICLAREPDNPHDNNAIAYRLIFGGKIHHLGYINKDLAKELAPKMDAGERYYAEITELTGGVEGKENRGVNVAIYRGVG